jgi:flagellar assembly protein FliH
MDQMPSTDKFSFFRSFDQPAPNDQEAAIEEEAPEEPEVIVPTFSEEEVENARAEGVAQGREEGIKEASETTERLINETTQSIHAQLNDVFTRQTNANSEIFRDSINAAIAVVKKSFPQMTDVHGTDEIEKMVGKILTHILEEPRVVISVNEEIKEPLSVRMEDITKSAHFDGRVVIRGESDISQGDCKIEWSNGGAERNLEELWQQIDQVVEENLNATTDGMEFDTLDTPISDDMTETETPPSAEQEIVDESANPNNALTDNANPNERESTAPEVELQSDPKISSDTLQTTPPTPSLNEAEELDNTQNTALQDENNAPDSHSITPETNAQDHASNLDELVPSQEENNADMEPDAEVGILTDTADTVEHKSTEPSG